MASDVGSRFDRRGDVTKLRLNVRLIGPHSLASQRKAPLSAGLELRGRGLAYPAPFGRFSFETNVFGFARLAAPHHSALLTTAREEGVCRRRLALASLHLMKSLAVGRAVAHMNPPAAVPQITGADTQSEFSVTLGASFHSSFLFWPSGIVRARSGRHPSPVGHLLRISVQSRSRNMVSSGAKNGFNCVSCGTFHRDEASCGVVRQHWDIDPVRMMRTRFADPIRASSPPGLLKQRREPRRFGRVLRSRGGRASLRH